MKLNNTLTKRIAHNRKMQIKFALAEALKVHKVNPDFLDKSRIGRETTPEGHDIWRLDGKAILEVTPNAENAEAGQVAMAYKIFDP